MDERGERLTAEKANEDSQLLLLSLYVSLDSVGCSAQCRTALLGWPLPPVPGRQHNGQYCDITRQYEAM